MPPVVRIAPQPPPFRGASLEYAATASDPDNDAVTVQWAITAGKCPDVLDSHEWPTAWVNQRPFTPGTPATFPVAAPDTQSRYCVWAEAVDKWGAVAVDAADVTPTSRPPVPSITLTSTSNPTNVGTTDAFPPKTVFSLSTDGTTDDGDSLDFTWILKSGPTDTSALASCGSMASDTQRCLTASIAGSYDVELVATDHLDPSIVATVDRIFKVVAGPAPVTSLELVAPTGVVSRACAGPACEAAGPFSLGTMFHLSGARSTGLDASVSQPYTWQPLDVSGAPGSIAHLGPCPGLGAADQCFTADAPGTYGVTLAVSNDSGAAPPQSWSLVVSPDVPPCIVSTLPMFGPTPIAASAMDVMPEVHGLFVVENVWDDLDPFPNVQDPTKQVTFAWSLDKNAGGFSLVGTGSDFTLPLDEYTAGDEVRVRLEVRDDNTNRSDELFAACGDADECHTTATCPQRVTWTVKFKL